MAININNDFSKYYKGTKQIRQYNSGSAEKKTTLKKYEFNTKDKYGNKIMDKMSKEETMKTLNDISSQYEENIIVQFSGDGLAALVERDKLKSAYTMTEEDVAAKEARDAAFQAESVIQLENTHRIVIPNIKINTQLYNSLDGADDNIISSAMGIISNYLLPSNVSGISESERKDMVAFGMEEAKYLAENYLNEKQAGEFISAMETIAKYGINGKMAEDGAVVYNIEKGLNFTGKIDDMDILKEKAPDLYKEINELNQRIINHKDSEKFGAEFLKLFKKAEKVLNSKNGKEETNIESALNFYKEWEKEIEDTKIPSSFKNVKYDNFQSFMESLHNQSKLSNKWLDSSIARFMKWINNIQ